MGAFELNEGADGGLVEIDEEICGPPVAGWKFVGSAEFFVTKPAAKAESFEDLLEGRGVSKDGFQFFANLVMPTGRRRDSANGELFGGRFEGEEIAFRGFLGGSFLPFSRRGGRFCADAEELAVFGKATVGSVEEEIQFMDTRGDRLGAVLC